MEAEDAKKHRTASLAEVERLGFPAPPDHLPWRDVPAFREPTAIIERALTLNVVLATSFLMPTDLARAWLEENGLSAGLTPGEKAFLAAVDRGEDPASGGHRLQVEAQWVLCWALGLASELSFSEYCGEEMASFLPDLRSNEDRSRFDDSANARPSGEIYGALDLVYCLTWGAGDANLTGKDGPGPLEQYALWERRRALEWLCGEDWGEFPTDT